MDDNGKFVYRSVVILGPRRLGKTSIMEPVLIHRGEQARCEMAMTAATGEMAGELFGEVTDGLLDSPVADRFARARSQGYSRLTFNRTGSVLRAVTPNARIGHSKSLRIAWVDEFWAHTTEQLKEMRAGYRPTFLTTGGQEWLTSTAGDLKSDAFMAARRQGRADVLAGRNTGRAFFDIAAPDETEDGTALADLSDTELIDFLAWNHPSTGHLFSREELVELMMLDLEDLGGRSGLLRAYGNLTDVGEDVHPAAFDSDRMRASRGAKIPGGVRVAFGVAVDDDRRDACIAVAWRDPAGLAHTAYRFAEGTRWVAAEVVRLAGEYDTATVAVQSAGPARDVADALDLADVPLLRLSQPDTAAAGSRFHDEFQAGTVLWDGSTWFSAAVAAAATVRANSGLVWRSHDGKTVSPLNAGTMALWGIDHAPTPEAPLGDPEIW